MILNPLYLDPRSSSENAEGMPARMHSPAGKGSDYGGFSGYSPQLKPPQSGQGIYATIAELDSMQVHGLAKLRSPSVKQHPHYYHQGDLSHVNYGDPRPVSINKMHNYNSHLRTMAKSGSLQTLERKRSGSLLMDDAYKQAHGRHDHNPDSFQNFQRRLVLKPLDHALDPKKAITPIAP